MSRRLLLRAGNSLILPLMALVATSLSGCNQTTGNKNLSSHVAYPDSQIDLMTPGFPPGVSASAQQPEPPFEDPASPLQPAAKVTASEAPRADTAPSSVKIAAVQAPAPVVSNPAALPRVVNYVEHFQISPLPSWPSLPPQQSQVARLSRGNFLKVKTAKGLQAPVFAERDSYVQVATKTHQLRWIRRIDVRLPAKGCVNGRGVLINGRGGHAVASGAGAANVVCD